MNCPGIDIRNGVENDVFAQFEASNANAPPTFLDDVYNFDIGDLDFGLTEELSQTSAPFPSFDNDLWMNSSFSSLTSSNSFSSSPSSSTTSITPFTRAGLYIQRLSGLSMNLYENAAQLVPPGFSLAASLENSKYCKPDGSDFPIDQTFSHTQTLLEIMDEIFPRPQSSVPLHAAFFISNPGDPNQFQHLILDPATMLLVLSCYIRLVDIYETLFEHIQICLLHMSAPCLTEARVVSEVSKNVQVGSYNVESPMTASMSILNIFLCLSRQLFDRMRGISGVMGFSDGSDAFVSRTGHAEVTETVFKSAEKRTHEASQKFNTVRLQLFELGVL